VSETHAPLRGLAICGDFFIRKAQKFMHQQQDHLRNAMFILGMIVTLMLCVLVYIVDNADTLEKRIDLLEQHSIESDTRENDLRDALFQATSAQDDTTAFQNRTEKKLNNVNDKVNKFYSFVKNRTIIVV
jgi:hypothetical protein